VGSPPLLDPDFMLSVPTCGSWNVERHRVLRQVLRPGLPEQGAAMSPAKRQQLVYQMQRTVATERPTWCLTTPT
jgi:hypothetical protein